MSRKTLLVLSAALATAACTESPTSINIPYTGTAPLQEIRGTVATEAGEGSVTVFLVLDGGTRVYLSGSEALRLTSVEGAEVMVRGAWSHGVQPLTDDAWFPDANPPTFDVAEFLVTAVDGHVALDGVLVETEGGYALRLAGGAIQGLDDPPGELTEHVGERVWITGLDDERFMRFGVIP